MKSLRRLLWGSFQCLYHDDDLTSEKVHAAVQIARLIRQCDGHRAKGDQPHFAGRRPMFRPISRDKRASRTSSNREILKQRLPIHGLRVGLLCGCDEQSGSNPGMQIQAVNNP